MSGCFSSYRLAPAAKRRSIDSTQTSPLTELKSNSSGAPGSSSRRTLPEKPIHWNYCFQGVRMTMERYYKEALGFPAHLEVDAERRGTGYGLAAERTRDSRS